MSGPTTSVWGFPGQGIGATAVAAALDENRGDPLVVALSERTGIDDWSGLDMRQTSVSQPAVFVAGVLGARHLEAPPALVVGHSLGELTALAAAGGIDAHAGLELVVARGLACESVRRDGEMMAVMGVEGADLEWVRRWAIGTTGAVLEVAAVNGHGQVVLSGAGEAIDACVAEVGRLGGIAQRLPIGGGFHSPLMVDALASYREALANADVRRPRVPWLSSVDLAVHDDPDKIREVLARALLLPVRWLGALQAAEALGCRELVDIGPDRTLAKLSRRSGASLHALTLDEALQASEGDR
jgi:[acyl-carrier-protein] S-malonyltransferase